MEMLGSFLRTLRSLQNSTIIDWIYFTFYLTMFLFFNFMYYTYCHYLVVRHPWLQMGSASRDLSTASPTTCYTRGRSRSRGDSPDPAASLQRVTQHVLQAWQVKAAGQLYIRPESYLKLILFTYIILFYTRLSVYYVYVIYLTTRQNKNVLDSC